MNDQKETKKIPSFSEFKFMFPSDILFKMFSNKIRKLISMKRLLKQGIFQNN